MLEKVFPSSDKIKAIYAFVRGSLREDMKPNKFVLCTSNDLFTIPSVIPLSSNPSGRHELQIQIASGVALKGQRGASAIIAWFT